MQRRTFLAGAGVTAGTAAAIAGCLADPDSPESDPSDDGTDDASDDGDGNGNDAAENNEDVEDQTDGPSAFAAELSRPRYVLSMNEQFADVARSNSVTPLEDVDPAAVDAIEAAIDADDDTYETDEAETALREGLFGIYYVEDDGTIYEVEYDLPVYVVSGRDVSESEADPERTISRMDDRLRVLGVDNREIINAVNTVLEPADGGDTGGASDDEYRAPVLDEQLAEFLDSYDYVVYPGDGENEPDPEGYVELALDHEDAGPPYTISVEEVPDETRYGRPVADVATYSGEAAEALRTAADQRTFRTDTPPAGIDEALDADAYVRVDGAVYDPSLETIDHDAVPVSLELTEVDEDARSFTLAVEATDEPAVLFGGAPEPFGVLSAIPDADGGENEKEKETADGRAILWSDTYEDDGHVHVDERDGEPEIMVNDIGLTTELTPGEPMTETYAVRAEWGFEAGTYRVASSLSVEWGDLDDGFGGADSSSYPFNVSLSVPPVED